MAGYSWRYGLSRELATQALSATKAVSPPDGSPRRTARPASNTMRRVTIRDVASVAGVSIGTVSNALNRPSIVARNTLERVQDAITRTGFVRSTAAGQLRGGKSSTVGVVVLDLANPFFTDMVRGAEDVLREHGYMLMVCSSDESAEQELHYLRLLEEHRVDGLLITPAGDDLGEIAKLSAYGVPTVLLDRDASDHDLCSVTVDDVRGGQLAARHLLDLGHVDIALVNGPTTIRQCADRREGVRMALHDDRPRRDVPFQEISVPALTADHGERAVDALLALEPRPSAIVCANDLLALGVLKGLANTGLSVPHDLAVVGYDDITFASMLSPALTSVRQPKYELGAAAASLLVEEALGADHEHRSMRFEPELVARASSCRGESHPRLPRDRA